MPKSATARPGTLDAALLQTATRALGRRDAALRQVIRKAGACCLSPGRQADHLIALLRSIVFQQLSGKAAATIFGRVRALAEQSQLPAGPQRWLALRDQQLRAAGLSRQKISYVRDLCERVHDGRLPLNRLETMQDQEIIDRLIEVRGFGRWSAHMVLMFHLGRPDVWPIDDLGIRKALLRLDGLADLPKPSAILSRADGWRPYRTVASWYLWRLLDVTMEDVGW